MENGEEMTLDALALKYGTDKSSEWHRYAESYEKLLSPLRSTPVKAVVEIGVCRKWDGNLHICPSLAMWSEWFGPQAAVVGLDKCDFGINDGSVMTLVCDQGNKENLACARYAIQKVHPQGVDLIVDDGSHEAMHQQMTMKALWPTLRVGGCYIIEDLNYNPEHADKSARRRTRECVEDACGGLKAKWMVDLNKEAKQFARVEWVDSAKAGPRSSVVIWKADA